MRGNLSAVTVEVSWLLKFNIKFYQYKRSDVFNFKVFYVDTFETL